MSHRLFHGDCIELLPRLGAFDCVFADVPDNIGRDYNEYDDNLPDAKYLSFIERVIWRAAAITPVLWLSFNSRWTLEFADIFTRVSKVEEMEFKPCVQTFTFGTQQTKDLKNCHRPLWRLMRKGAPLYPDQAREQTWRLLNGDKRADPRGAVPGDWHDTVFDVPRVVGNSKQKRRWHDNQLNEELVARCLKLTTKPGDSVCDPFGGTGTTLRVCEKLGRRATLIELDGTYCREIAHENGIEIQAA